MVPKAALLQGPSSPANVAVPAQIAAVFPWLFSPLPHPIAGGQLPFIIQFNSIQLNESIRDHCTSFLPLIACPLSRALLHSIWVIAISYHPLFLSYRTLLEVRVSHQQPNRSPATHETFRLYLSSLVSQHQSCGWLSQYMGLS
jgi:hypothetical protein